MPPPSSANAHASFPSSFFRSSAPRSPNSRKLSLDYDIRKALRLIYRSPWARSFLLNPSAPSSDLNLLTASRPSFTISTEEVQEGTVPGQIALSYLGLPVFSDVNNLSGGLVVTQYAGRSHPLHDPSFIADVRVGRYVRDDTTGEWCMITRSRNDRIVRLQFTHVNHQRCRERISLTCDSDLFDRGRFIESVFFKCHDLEWSICPTCSQTNCRCPVAISDTVQHDLSPAARAFVCEGPGEWLGSVRVTVLNNFSVVPLLDVDDTMSVRSTYRAGQDSVLCRRLRRLAIAETVSQSQSFLTIPGPISPPLQDPALNEELPKSEDIPLLAGGDLLSPLNASPRPNPSLPLTPPLSPTKSPALCERNPLFLEPTPSSMPWSPELFSEDLFGNTGDEIADHFLIARDAPFPYFDETEMEHPMLPADLSTLPAGVESCLDGMDLDDLDDDCISLMTSDRDTHSLTSALSTAGSDGVPPLDSVPLPGDDFLDAISALNLSRSDYVADKSVDVKSENDLFTGISTPSNSINDLPSSFKPKICTSPINESTLEHLRGSMDSDLVIKPLNLPQTELQATSQIIDKPTIGGRDYSKVEQSEPCATQEACNMAAIRARELVSGNNDKEVGQRGNGEEVSSDPSINRKSRERRNAHQACPVDRDAERKSVVERQFNIINGMESQPPYVSQHMVPLFDPSQRLPCVPGIATPLVLFPNPLVGSVAASQDPGVSQAQALPFSGNFSSVVPLPRGFVCNDKVDPASITMRHVEAPKLAPRPPGMNVEAAPWQLNPMYVPDQRVLNARFEALEKERRAEERRKKNRQAAARSNARKKYIMDGIRSEIRKHKERAEQLRSIEAKLKHENEILKNHTPNANLHC